jgi:hypothetical protein
LFPYTDLLRIKHIDQIFQQELYKGNLEFGQDAQPTLERFFMDASVDELDALIARLVLCFYGVQRVVIDSLNCSQY